MNGRIKRGEREEKERKDGDKLTRMIANKSISWTEECIKEECRHPTHPE